MFVRGLIAALLLLWPATEGLAQSFFSSQSGADRPANDDAGLVPPDVLKIPQFPVPPNSTVVLGDTVIVGDDEEWTGQVFLGAPYSVIQITQFYRAEMPKAGWVETAIVRSRRTSISYSRGNRFATLRLVPQKDEAKYTDIDLVVSPVQSPSNSGQRRSQIPDRNPGQPRARP
ncbi:MAG: hypothetical protein WCF85_18950 [Rhodospirillaceae bacterium]